MKAAGFAKNDPSVLFGAMAPDVQWNEAQSNPLADRNPYPGAQAISAKVDAPFCHVYRFVGGQIVSLQQYTDAEQWARLMA